MGLTCACRSESNTWSEYLGKKKKLIKIVNYKLLQEQKQIKTSGKKSPLYSMICSRISLYTNYNQYKFQTTEEKHLNIHKNGKPPYKVIGRKGQISSHPSCPSRKQMTQTLRIDSILYKLLNLQRKIQINFTSDIPKHNKTKISSCLPESWSPRKNRKKKKTRIAKKRKFPCLNRVNWFCYYINFLRSHIPLFLYSPKILVWLQALHCLGSIG